MTVNYSIRAKTCAAPSTPPQVRNKPASACGRTASLVREAGRQSCAPVGARTVAVNMKLLIGALICYKMRLSFAFFANFAVKSATNIEQPVHSRLCGENSGQIPSLSSSGSFAPAISKARFRLRHDSHALHGFSPPS